MRLLLGTSNPGKITEIRSAFSGLPVEIVTPMDLGITEHPNEEGETFAENARQKARLYHALSGGLATLADDSGIVVEALRNELGIHTRRWGAGADVSDHHWISVFLERMRSESNKRARFLCTLCLVDEEGREHFFEGTCDGTITDELEAEYLPGLPISACFRPEGFDRVYSALSVEEKNRVSHRGRALAAARVFLENDLL